MKTLFIRVLATLRNLYYYSKHYIASVFSKTDKDFIFFSSYSGKSFNDNPKAIFDYLLDYNFTMIWSFKNNEDLISFKKQFPNHIAVKYNSLKHYYYLKKAGTWIFNFKTPPYFVKNKETTFIQTWHGVPLKRLGCDIINENQTFYRSKQSYESMAKSYINEGIKSDYFISVSPYCKDKLKSAFQLAQHKFIDIDYPRKYKLYQNNNIQEIKNKFNIKPDDKVILYAPTWRDDSHTLAGFTNDFILDFDSFNNQLNEQYIILYRPHYLIKQHTSSLPKNVIDVSQYHDLNDLFLISDLLITDYSSIYFDYSVLNKPIYFYMPDLENYMLNLRGFYININTDLPNDYHQAQVDLAHAINNSIVNKQKLTNFLQNNKSYELDFNKIIDKIKTQQ